MNFFEHQDQARRNTTRLVAFLLLAVACLIAMTVLLFAVVIVFNSGATYPPGTSTIDILKQSLAADDIVKIALGVLAVVGLASLYKLSQLSRGGEAVAEALGGRQLNTTSSDPDERKVLNIVEEMAIASGMPVPPVYLMEESAINAFAAGYKGQDAVIGVTRGCIQQLDRDELQGVIAHEFSHILHGDMRLNIRLVGILHGILIIGLAGYFILRAAPFSGRSRSKNNGSAMGIFALGLALMAIGYAGTFFGNLIKAAVSRQREFLADASAVQFSRNPAGIAGALKKIGGFPEGSELHNENAAEFSHMYFGSGVNNFLGMLATHPPLEERIQRIEPGWKGGFETVHAQAHGSDEMSGIGGQASRSQSEGRESGDLAGHQVSSGEQTVGAAPGQAQSSMTGGEMPSAIDSIGQPSPSHLSYAAGLIHSLPDSLKEAAHDSFSARALVYNLLLSPDPLEADKQRDLLKKHAHPVVYKNCQALEKSMRGLKAEYRLPLLELSIPAIKMVSPRQYEVFKANVVRLIQADKKIELFEWAMYRILIHNTEQPQTRSGNKSIQSLKAEVELLLSAMAYAGHNDNDGASRAFNKARDQLPLGNLSLVPGNDIDFPTLDRVVRVLALLKPLQKPLLLKALAESVSHDGKVSAGEAELFRAVSDSLDCPIPPLLPEQALA